MKPTIRWDALTLIAEYLRNVRVYWFGVRALRLGEPHLPNVLPAYQQPSVVEEEEDPVCAVNTAKHQPSNQPTLRNVHMPACPPHA